VSFTIYSTYTEEEAVAASTEKCVASFQSCDLSAIYCTDLTQRQISPDDWSCSIKGTNFSATSTPTARTEPEARALASADCQNAHDLTASGCVVKSCM
jgi:hypothetical protein